MITESPFYPEWKYVSFYFNKTKGRWYATLRKSKTEQLSNGEKSQTGMTRARYLLSVHLGRYLDDNEEADHINNIKTDDRIDNLQVLTKDENREKYHQHFTSDIQEKVLLRCAECGKTFKRIKWRHDNSVRDNNENDFCSMSCRSTYNVKNGKTGLKQPIDDHIRSLVISDVKRGMTYLDCGYKHGISKSMVYKIVKERNIVLDKKDFTAIREQVLQLRNENVSYREIARRLNIGDSTVSKIIKDAGLVTKENKVCDDDTLLPLVKQGRIDGKSNTLLCEELGISTFKLNRLLNRLHLVRDGHGKLDEKDFNYIKALYDSGMGRNEIADRLKMSKATVQTALIKLGLSRQYQKRDKVKVFTDIYLLKRLGDSISSIAEKLQIDKKSVGVIYNQFKDRVQSHMFLNEDDYKNKCDRIFGNHMLLHSEYRGENTYQVDVLLLENEA